VKPFEPRHPGAQVEQERPAADYPFRRDRLDAPKRPRATRGSYLTRTRVAFPGQEALLNRTDPYFRSFDDLAVPSWQRAHLRIAHVPEGRQVFGALTVLENIEMGAYSQSGRSEWTRNIGRIFALFPVLAERRHQRWRSDNPRRLAAGATTLWQIEIDGLVRNSRHQVRRYGIAVPRLLRDHHPKRRSDLPVLCGPPLVAMLYAGL
jgi:hypothetical protein